MTSVRVFLRLADFPELSQLSRAELKRLAGSIPLGSRVRLLATPLLAGLLAGAGTIAVAGSDLIAVLMAAVAAGAVSLGTRALMMIYVRAGIIEALSDAERTGQVTMCLRCGYDMTGAQRTTCPECGRTISRRRAHV